MRDRITRARLAATGRATVKQPTMSPATTTPVDPASTRPATRGVVRRMPNQRTPLHPVPTDCGAPGRNAPDQGTTTAEYAMVTMAAVAFASVLIKVVGGDEVAGILTGLVRRALSI